MSALIAAAQLLVAQAITDFEDRNKLLETLSRQITRYNSELEKGMPETVRRKIAAAKSTNVHSLDRECQEWLRRDSHGGEQADIWENFNKLKEIRTTDDGVSILLESFVCHVQGKPFDLTKCVDLIGIYWLENEIPNIHIAPEGKGKVEWLWGLDVQTRPHGILHVGIDTVTRRFLCFERGVGVYYPEGETLERIYSEIVQNPLVAGIHIGNGRVTEANRSKPAPEKGR